MHPAGAKLDDQSKRVFPGPGVNRTNGSTQRLWQAVATREARLDGAFVYAVRSTRIYCRPSCPARRPRRGQVVFFDTAEAAEREGFRACRRCRPHEAPHRKELELIGRACRILEAHAEGPLRLADLAAETGVAPPHLRRLFLRLLGISPRSYADGIRLRRLKQRLREGDSVTTALYQAGYGSASRLYEGAHRHLGMTPATYGRGGRGMEIAYSTADCPLGRLLVAGTRRGISAIYLGDRDVALEAALRKEYPDARIRRNGARVSRWVLQIVRHLSGRQPRLQLPLDVAATAFQQRVWEALQRIPYGATRSYTEIARSIDCPQGARAVARACATNPACLVIPCHRVVGKNKGLAGYRWGLKRKRALLQLEQRERTGSKRKATAAPSRRGKARKERVTPAA